MQEMCFPILKYRTADSNRSSIAVLLLSLIVATSGDAAAPPSLVPPPDSMKVYGDHTGLEIGNTLQVVLPKDAPQVRGHFEAVAGALEFAKGYQLKTVDDDNVAANLPVVFVKLVPGMGREQYELSVGPRSIEVTASTPTGVARATSTLMQLLAQPSRTILPALEISDKPSCDYRSFMVDLGRNPHSVECLKETIDLLWYYKVDSLHLHLTDDQRFAFPSRAFPKLASQDHRITWDEFKELDRYAQVRGVSIIPELEVPGHSGILRNQYPEVFGESSTDVARLTSSRAAIKTLLDEMIEVFQSARAIHVGGDEAFGVPEDLQRNLINELHTFLASRGKETIVWEGPRLGTGDNKVHEDVIHINWRTINFPADQMLEAGYPVVNAAWDPLYLVDHYPRNNFTMVSPEHIFSTLEICRFKHVNPGIPTYANPVVVEPSDRLLGFCMPWWEGREENYFPLVVPRLIPMASVAWNHEQPRNYDEFARSVSVAEAVRRACFYPVTIHATPLDLEDEGVFSGTATVSIGSSEEGDVHYSLDGTPPTPDSPVYETPIVIEDSCTVRARLFADGASVGHGSRRTFVHVVPQPNLALGRPVIASVGEGPVFSAARVTDGGTGNLDFFLAYADEPQPIEITVDLGEPTSFDHVVVHGYSNGNTFESHAVQVSEDGIEYETVSEQWERPEESSSRTVHKFPERTARFVRILTRGCKGYVFDSFSKLTEIQVFSGVPPEIEAPR